MKNKTKGPGNLGPFGERAINLTHLIHLLLHGSLIMLTLNAT